MNCENCGAPMKLIRESDYFFCEYCSSFYFPHESIDGVRVLNPLPYPVECPLCAESLYKGSIKQYPAMHCRKCKGTLMQQFLFGEVVQYLRSRAKGPADRPRKLDEAGFLRHVQCPYCHCQMQTHPYAGPGNIVIDTCPSCSVIWLDYGELNRVINAPGRDRGQPWYLDEPSADLEVQ